jgi:long-chain fatty acid transport protein
LLAAEVAFGLKSFPMRPALVLIPTLVLASASARADDCNFRPYLIGSRAAGMGGAFTALSDDGSGAYYNPGGVAFVKTPQLSLSGSVYGLSRGTYADMLGDGHDFTYSGIQTLPTATAGLYRFDGGAPDRAHVVGFGVYVPDAVSIDDRDTVGSKQNAFMFSKQEQTVWAGVVYAYRWGPLGIGVAGFFQFRTASTTADFTAVNADDASVFATVSTRMDSTTYGGLGALGLRWDVTDQVHLGASVYTPAWGGGKRREFIRLAVAGAQGPGTAGGIVVINEDDLHASPTTPLRVQAGGAWTYGPLTLAADVVFLAPRTVHDDEDRMADGLDNMVVRNFAVNGSIGAEFVINDTVPLRAGFFTDFAATQTPTSGPSTNVNAANTSHIHRFGGSLSVGYRTEHTSTDVGATVSGGVGSDLVPDNLDVTKAKATTSSQLLVYLFIGTSYSF